MTEREDRQDIAELLVRYATAIDRREWPLLGSVFTEDCHADYGEIGSWQSSDAITEFMETVHAGAAHTLHRLSNLAINVDGNNAEARTYFDALIMAADNQSGVNAIGYYDDEIVRTANGWRIARRRLTTVRLITVGST